MGGAEVDWSCYHNFVIITIIPQFCIGSHFQLSKKEFKTMLYLY